MEGLKEGLKIESRDYFRLFLQIYNLCQRVIKELQTSKDKKSLEYAQQKLEEIYEKLFRLHKKVYPAAIPIVGFNFDNSFIDHSDCLKIVHQFYDLCKIVGKELQKQPDQHTLNYCNEKLEEMIAKLEKSYKKFHKADEVKQKQAESKKSSVQKIKLSDLVFDQKFSSEFYTFQNFGRKATWKCKSKKEGFKDYNQFPTLRLNRLLKNEEIYLKFKIAYYGWFGFGSRFVSADGFPGYTSEGWMLCTDGRIYHDKVQIGAHKVNLANKQLVVKVNTATKTMQIENQVFSFGENVPDEVFFVISVAETTVELFYC